MLMMMIQMMENNENRMDGARFFFSTSFVSWFAGGNSHLVIGLNMPDGLGMSPMRSETSIPPDGMYQRNK